MSVNLGTVHVSLEMRLQKLKDGIRDAKRDLSGFEASLEKLAVNTKRIGQNMSLSITAPILLLGKQAIKTAADMDALERGMAGVMGSAQAASKEMAKLREVAKLPGLGMEDAVRGSLRLQGMGTSADEARRILLAFGNAVARMGGGMAELDGVTRALGQTLAKGKISMEEVLQLAERQIPVFQAMKKIWGTADTELLTKMGVSAQEFVSKLTTFFGAQEKVGDSAKNKIENLGQAWDQFLSKIGKTLLEGGLSNAMDGFIKKLDKASEWFSKLSPAAQETFTNMTVALAAGGPLLVGLSVLVSSISNLHKAFTLLAANAAFRALFIPTAVAGGGVYAFQQLDKNGFFDWLAKVLPGGEGTTSLVGGRSLNVTPDPKAAARRLGKPSLMPSRASLLASAGTTAADPTKGSLKVVDSAAAEKAKRIAEINRQAQYELADPVKQAYMDMAKNLSEGMSRANAKGLFRKQLNEILEDLNRESLDIGKRDGGVLTNIMLGDGSLSPQFQTTLRKTISQLRAKIAPMLDLDTDRMWELRTERLSKGEPETNFLGMINAMENALGGASAKFGETAKGRNVAGLALDPKDIGNQLAGAAQEAKAEANRFTFPLGKELGSNLAYEMGREFSSAFDKIFGTGNPLTRALSRTLSQLVDDVMMALAQRAIGQRLMLSLFGGAAGGLAGTGTTAAAGMTGAGLMSGGAAGGAKAAGLSAGAAWTAGFAIAAAWGFSRVMNSIFKGSAQGKANLQARFAMDPSFRIQAQNPGKFSGMPSGYQIYFQNAQFNNDQDPERAATRMAWHLNQKMRSRPGS